MDIDIEIAMPEISEAKRAEILGALPRDFYSEDRESQGWGTVIRMSSVLPEGLDAAVSAFLGGLKGIAPSVASAGGILRLAVYHQTYTCTVRLNSVQLISEFGLALEISTYPTADDDDDEDS